MAKKKRSMKGEMATDKYGSRKYRGLPADQTHRPKPYTLEKVWVGAHKSKGKHVKGHFRKAPRRHR